MRRHSVSGPIVLIAVGGFFLLNNFRPDIPLGQLFARFWPLALVALGIIQLVEVLATAGQAQPIPRRTGGIVWVLAIVLGAGWMLAQRSPARFHFANFQGNAIELFGEQYGYPVSARGDASGVTMLVLENLRGNVTVTGTDGSSYVLEGHKSIRTYHKADADEADRKTQVHFVREGNQLVLRGDERGISSHLRISTDLDIKLPRGISVQARARSGDLTVSSVGGAVDLASDRGDVRLADIGGNARVNVSHSGLIRAVDCEGSLDLEGKGNDIHLENVAGQVSISGSYSGTLEFKNLGKPLHFESERTDLRVERIPGSFTMDLSEIRAANIVGPFSLRTRSRDIHLDNFSDTMEIQIERGDIELTPAKPLAKIDVHSRNGDIELNLPGQADFDLRASTNQGDAHNDYGPGVRQEQEGRAASLRSVDAKGAPITVSTGRGSVSVRKT